MAGGREAAKNVALRRFFFFGGGEGFLQLCMAFWGWNVRKWMQLPYLMHAWELIARSS